MIIRGIVVSLLPMIIGSIRWIGAGSLLAFASSSCSQEPSGPRVPLDRTEVRSGVRVVNEKPGEFGAPMILPVANDAWEDGLFVTRDGLDLYCIYSPADVMSFIVAGADQKKSASFLRGPTQSMDMKTSPIGSEAWIHADIYRSTRSTRSGSFTKWQAVNMADPIVNEGAPQGVSRSGSNFDYFVYMRNRDSEPWDDNIWIQTSVGRALAAKGRQLPDNVNSTTNEDNPHIEILDDGSLILFFERVGHPGNLSERDIWYCQSTDKGKTWTDPKNLEGINRFRGTGNEHVQPHLYRSSKGWQLYFSCKHSDGKLAIFRCNKGGGWDDWSEPELVLSAGNTLGVGEPTLTDSGDLYFVVVTQHPNGNKFDRFDSDPWMMPRK